MALPTAHFGSTGHVSSRIIFGAAALGAMDQDRADGAAGGGQDERCGDGHDVLQTAVDHRLCNKAHHRPRGVARLGLGSAQGGCHAVFCLCAEMEVETN